MVWPRLTNIVNHFISHLPNKEIAGVPVSNLDQFDYTYNSELDAPSLHVLLLEYMYTYGQLEH